MDRAATTPHPNSNNKRAVRKKYLIPVRFKSKCTDVCLCSVCKTDEGTCGCCLMQQRVHRMATYFNDTLNELDKLYQQADKCLRNIEGDTLIHAYRYKQRYRYRYIRTPQI